MTDNTNDSRLFAFGRNEYNGCECPAVTAGFDPEKSQFVADVVKEYDRIISRGRAESVGIVDERQAKHAWISTIKEFNYRDAPRKAEIACEAAKELGWK